MDLNLDNLIIVATSYTQIFVAVKLRFVNCVHNARQCDLTWSEQKARVC